MISVIMPLFNEEIKDLETSIESILNQTEKRLELILILDNPENMRIKQLMEHYESIDTRVKLLFNSENKGVGLTLNKAISHAKFDLIARLDADDISCPNRLERQLEFLEKNKDVDMLSTNCIYIDEYGNIIGEKPNIPTDYKSIKTILPFGSTIIHSSVIYKKKSFDKLGGYRQLLSCQDYDLWLRMVDANMKICSLNERLIYYRVRPDSITGSQQLRLLLTEKYVRILHSERKKNGIDSFSFNNYLDYLDVNGYNDHNKRERFNDAANIFNDGIEQIKNKNYLVGLKYVTKSIFVDKRICIRMNNLFVYKYKRKKLNV